MQEASILFEVPNLFFIEACRYFAVREQARSFLPIAEVDNDVASLLYTFFGRHTVHHVRYRYLFLSFDPLPFSALTLFNSSYQKLSKDCRLRSPDGGSGYFTIDRFPPHSPGFPVIRPFPGNRISDEESDPFLLLDYFKKDWPPGQAKGAPWHPHRGFQTVSYILSGGVQHKDSMGNSGILTDGASQWMNAGTDRHIDCYHLIARIWDNSPRGASS